MAGRGCTCLAVGVRSDDVRIFEDHLSAQSGCLWSCNRHDYDSIDAQICCCASICPARCHRVDKCPFRCCPEWAGVNDRDRGGAGFGETNPCALTKEASANFSTTHAVTTRIRASLTLRYVPLSLRTSSEGSSWAPEQPPLAFTQGAAPNRSGLSSQDP